MIQYRETALKPGNPTYDRERRQLQREDARKAEDAALERRVAAEKELEVENERRLRAGQPLVEIAPERNLVPLAEVRPNELADFRDRDHFEAALAAGEIYSEVRNGVKMVDRDQAALANLAAVQARTGMRNVI